ncbi:MAG TPA: Crp/Fnr family transcriptional regulator [Candidatus Polarisedimenticolia bacterium]|nr:Crp/Fnr family transcriptional regulator [Candidatus Polarisedimenticolia bacterium]
MTPVERVLILKGADLLKDVGPRHLLGLAEVAREVEISKGDRLYDEGDPADALYMVVEGRVRLSIGDRTTSEVGPGQAFGTWALVDDSSRGHRAECIEGGMALALQREDFYDMAAGDLTLLQEVVRVLAKRLRSLVSDRPEEARVEDEGIEKPLEAPTGEAAPEAATAGAALEAAALGQTDAAAEPGKSASSEPEGG